MRASHAAVINDPALFDAVPLPCSPLTKLDRLGILISSLCLMHCLALPLVAVLLPAFAEVLPSDLWVHVVLIGFALPVSGFTLLRGYLAHRRRRPALIGAAGLLVVISGAVAAAPVAGVALTVVGGALVAGAHMLNMRDYGPACVLEHHASA